MFPPGKGQKIEDRSQRGELAVPVECNPIGFLSPHLEGLKEKNFYRELRTAESPQDSWVTLEGRKVLNLCSNNYLGMASHPVVKEAAENSTMLTCLHSDRMAELL